MFTYDYYPYWATCLPILTFVRAVLVSWKSTGLSQNKTIVQHQTCVLYVYNGMFWRQANTCLTTGFKGELNFRQYLLILPNVCGSGSLSPWAHGAAHSQRSFVQRAQYSYVEKIYVYSLLRVWSASEYGYVFMHEQHWHSTQSVVGYKCPLSAEAVWPVL